MECDNNKGGHVHRGVVPGHCVRLSEETIRVAGPLQSVGDEPRVELIRDGDTIKAIDVTCTCGRRFRLRCDY